VITSNLIAFKLDEVLIHSQQPSAFESNNQIVLGMNLLRNQMKSTRSIPTTTLVTPNRYEHLSGIGYRDFYTVLLFPTLNHRIPRLRALSRCDAQKKVQRCRAIKIIELEAAVTVVDGQFSRSVVNFLFENKALHSRAYSSQLHS
jgi:hypothetical protein